MTLVQAHTPADLSEQPVGHARCTIRAASAAVGPLERRRYSLPGFQSQGTEVSKGRYVPQLDLHCILTPLTGPGCSIDREILFSIPSPNLLCASLIIRISYLELNTYA